MKPLVCDLGFKRRPQLRYLLVLPAQLLCLQVKYMQCHYPTDSNIDSVHNNTYAAWEYRSRAGAVPLQHPELFCLQERLQKDQAQQEQHHREQRQQQLQ